MSTWLIVLAFTVLAFLVYRLWKPMIQPPKRKVEANKARLSFFYTDWCGFSQKAMPEWEKVEKNKSYYGKTHVEYVRVDCEKDKTTCTLYGVNAYPTIILETSEGIREYKGRMSHSGMKEFLSSTLGEESHSL